MSNTCTLVCRFAFSAAMQCCCVQPVRVCTANEVHPLGEASSSRIDGAVFCSYQRLEEVLMQLHPSPGQKACLRLAKCRLLLGNAHMACGQPVEASSMYCAVHADLLLYLPAEHPLLLEVEARMTQATAARSSKWH